MVGEGNLESFSRGVGSFPDLNDNLPPIKTPFLMFRGKGTKIAKNCKKLQKPKIKKTAIFFAGERK